MTYNEAINIYNEQGLQALCEQLSFDIEFLHTEEDLKWRIEMELADCVPNYNLVAHLSQALQNESSTGYYDYDYSMGTLEEPTPINTIEDLDLENYLE